MTDKIVVFTTCPTADEADRLARHLIQSRLAACVQITPAIQSLYHWQGMLESSDEIQLTIKTRRDLFEALCTELRKLHSYDVPEIIAVPIVDGAPSYLEWMDQELQPLRNV